MRLTLDLVPGAGQDRITELMRATTLKWHAMPARQIEQLAQPKPKRARKPTLAGVAKQAARAGIEVARYEIAPDGKIIVVPGKLETISTIDSDTANEWDTVQ